MKANAGLQIIFAFFLGLVVVAFVGIGVNTFYPQPEPGAMSELGDRIAAVERKLDALGRALRE